MLASIHSTIYNGIAIVLIAFVLSFLGKRSVHSK